MSVMNPYSFALVHSIFKGENPINVISLKKSLMLACIQTFTD